MYSAKQKFKLGIFLFILGMAGVFSILGMGIALPQEIEALLLKDFSPSQIKWLMLINPTLFLLFFGTIGLLLFDKAEFRLPLFARLVGVEQTTSSINKTIIIAAVGGIVAGILLTGLGAVFYPQLPTAFMDLSEKVQPTLLNRFLYGGFTEEITMRFGLMTIFVWIARFIFTRNKAIAYWVGIFIAAFLFALGHLPIAFQTVQNPSVILISYILIGNTLGGIIYGWLYWKQGLGAAIIAHILTHVILLLLEPLII